MCFLFNQKTAYDMRISDWSSDVCSSDLPSILADTSPDIVFDYIKSISYPNNKAKHLVGMAKMLVEEFDGIIPNTTEELMRLPGVGRKTANVIASVVFNIPAMAVDTHEIGRAHV